MTIKNLLECDVLGTVALLEYKGKDEDGKVIEERLWTSEILAGLKDVPGEYKKVKVRSYYQCIPMEQVQTRS